jgi:hypothetical protein
VRGLEGQLKSLTTERGRHFGRQIPLADQLDERAGNRAQSHIARVGSRGHRQDVHAVARQALVERRRAGDLVDAALDLAGLGEKAGVLILHRLPGPREDAGIVTGDLEGEAVIAPVLLGVAQEVRPLAVVEQGVEGLAAPIFQGVKYPVGVLGFRGEGVTGGSGDCTHRRPSRSEPAHQSVKSHTPPRLRTRRL